MLGGAGPSDKHVVDSAAADRGKKIWVGECITCHGTNARGTEKGPNLVRSVLVLRDRYGTEIGPFLHKSHPTQSGTPSANLSKVQVEDLSTSSTSACTTRSGVPRYLKSRTCSPATRRWGRPIHGEGKCNACHSPTGDLAGIGKRYDPPTLQQRFLFPRPGVRPPGPRRDRRPSRLR